MRSKSRHTDTHSLATLSFSNLCLALSRLIHFRFSGVRVHIRIFCVDVFALPLYPFWCGSYSNLYYTIYSLFRSVPFAHSLAHWPFSIGGAFTLASFSHLCVQSVRRHSLLYRAHHITIIPRSSSHIPILEESNYIKHIVCELCEWAPERWSKSICIVQIICKLSVPFGFIKLTIIIKVIIMAITSDIKWAQTQARFVESCEDFWSLARRGTEEGASKVNFRPMEKLCKYILLPRDTDVVFKNQFSCKVFIWLFVKQKKNSLALTQREGRK